METYIENNLKIAKYLGWSYDYSKIRWAIPQADNWLNPGDNYLSGTRLEDDKLLFHSDWRWLMKTANAIKVKSGWYDPCKIAGCDKETIYRFIIKYIDSTIN